MKFGLISLDYRRFPLERCFQDAEKYGFDGVEIWGGRPHAWPKDMDKEAVSVINALKKRYRKEVPMYTPAALGMGVCLCAPDPRERSDALFYFKQAIDVANAIEIPSMLIVADHPGYEPDSKDVWNWLVESVSKLADYSKPKGVKICIEPLTPVESPVVTSAGGCRNLIQEVACENVCGMLDLVPPTVVCEPLSSYFEKLGDKLSYIHICGTDGTTDAHLSLDEGILPIEDVFRIFKEYGYCGYVTSEMYTVSARDPELYTARAARVLRTIREELGI